MILSNQIIPDLILLLITKIEKGDTLKINHYITAFIEIIGNTGIPEMTLKHHIPQYAMYVV